MDALQRKASDVRSSFIRRPRLHLSRIRPVVPAAPVHPASSQQHLLLGREELILPAAGSASAGVPADGSDPIGSSSSGAAGSGDAKPVQRSFWQQVKRFFIGDGLDKERLKALGMGAFASYGFVSNVNYGTALGIAWLAFVKKYGVAPTAEGQWPVFLAFYAGIWAVQNFARPLRISIALAMAPAFDLAITRIGQVLKIDKKWAFGVFLLCMGVLTSTVLFGTIFLLGGFPANPVLTATQH